MNTGSEPHLENGRRLKHVYFSALMEPAVWGAELALSGAEGRGYIYIVEPTGLFADDPTLTNKRIPGHPTQSFRTRAPLRVPGHPAEVLQGMLDSLADLKQRGLTIIED